MTSTGTRGTGTWPAIPRWVVARARLPQQPELPRTKVLHVITRFIGGSGGNTLLSAGDLQPNNGGDSNA